MLCAVWLGGCHAEVAADSVADQATLVVLGDGGITCGAVAVGPKLAVTANHCVTTSLVAFTRAARRGVMQRQGLGVVVVRDPTSDLAAFTAEGLTPAALVVGAVDFEHATTLVTHVPAPWSRYQVRPREAASGFLLTERLRVGMSGSGLWDDAGQLVGVAVGNDARSGYFADGSRIAALLAPTGELMTAKPRSAQGAVWGDPRLSLDAMVAATKQKREHIGAALRELERPK
jgi:hypothetical protein